MSNKTRQNLMEDPEDLELKAVKGDKFQDMSKAAPKVEKKAAANKKSCRKVMDAPWEPVKGAPTEIEKVVACAKHVGLYGGISMLLFYWQQAGLLASEAAVPSLILCALVAGLRIGSCAARG